jgi:replicative DNA helicase
MGIPTLSFPIEDGIKVAYKRLAGMHGEFNPLNLRLANELVTDTFVENAKRSLDEVAGMPMYLSGLRGTVADIAVEAQHAVANKGVKAVFVDAFKDIATRSDGVEGDNATIAGLCAMARRLNIQVVVTHHVRKNPSSMKGVDPRRAWTIEPSDLRGSGRLWDDARMVIALQMWPNGSIVNEREQFDYNLHLMKVNHGYAGFYFPVIRSVGGTWDEIQNI